VNQRSEPAPISWENHDPVAAFVSLTFYCRWSLTLRDAAAPFVMRAQAGEALSDDDLCRTRAFCNYWFASLYVVTEGWRRLRMKDSTIDTLLTQDHLDLLRRYRNAVFHYQPEPSNPRFTDLASAQTLHWVYALTEAFAEFFRRHIPEPDTRWITSWVLSIVDGSTWDPPTRKALEAVQEHLKSHNEA
jgi:hypothetical protein